jgi:hypothetical protein
MVWGQPEATYKKLKKGYDAAKTPIRIWKADNHLAARYNPTSGWLYTDWAKWNTALYPGAGAFSNSPLGGIPLVFYSNGWSNDTAHAHAPGGNWTFAPGDEKGPMGVVLGHPSPKIKPQGGTCALYMT